MYEIIYNRINSDLLLWEPQIYDPFEISPLACAPIHPAFGACKPAGHGNVTRKIHKFRLVEKDIHKNALFYWGRQILHIQTSACTGEMQSLPIVMLRLFNEAKWASVANLLFPRKTGRDGLRTPPFCCVKVA